MRPAWLARMLVWAGALLWFYWGVLKNYDPGAAFGVGLMLGAGTLVYNGDRPRVVPLMPVLTIAIALVILARGRVGDLSVLFFSYIIGILSPYLAWRLRGSEAPR